MGSEEKRFAYPACTQTVLLIMKNSEGKIQILIARFVTVKAWERSLVSDWTVDISSMWAVS